MAVVFEFRMIQNSDPDSGWGEHMRDLVLFNEPDHFQGVRLVHDHIGGADVQIRHEETVELGAMEQGQGMEADVVGLVLAVENTAVILRHERPVREHGTLGLGLCSAGVGNLYDIFRVDFHLRFIVGHGRHFRNQVEAAVGNGSIFQGYESPLFHGGKFIPVLGDNRIQCIFHDKYPRARMIDDVGYFFGVEHVVDGNLDGADFGQAHQAYRIIGRVVSVYRHPVAFFNSVACHQVGKTPCFPFEIIE